MRPVASSSDARGDDVSTSLSVVTIAAALWYAVVISILAKAALAIDLALDADSLEPVFIAPLALGADLVVAALLAGGVALVSRALSAWRGARLVVLVLVPWGFLIGMSVMSYRLTGSGITWQRLRGDEGATLSDLELLSRADLVVSLALVGSALALLPLLVVLCRRVAAMRLGAHPLAPAAVAALGLGLLAVHGLVDPVSYGLHENAVVVLAESFADGEERVLDDALELDEEGWRRLHEPSRPLGGDLSVSVSDAPIKNVVVMLAEGVPYRYTSFGEGGKDSTPHLRRRAEREGLLFERFYSHYHSSIQSIFSLVCSAYPPLYVREGTVAAQTPRIDCGEMSEHLERGGRRAGLFHGGRFAYYDKLALLGGRGYDVTLDAELLSERYPERKMHKWGIDDRAVVDATLTWIDSLPKGTPFGALLIPITAHYPYWIPRDVDARFPGKERADKFASAVSFLDDTFEHLVDGLEQRGLYEDTLVIFVADHGEKVDPLQHKHGGHRGHYQQSLHVPLVMLNPRLWPRTMTAGGEGARDHSTERTGGMIDLLPTILDALDLPSDPKHFGQSLISSEWSPRRVFFGAVTSGSMLSGFVEGDTKFALRIKDGSTELYDLRADPLEQKNEAERQRQRAERFSDDALTFYRANQVYFLKAPSLPDEQDVQHRLVEDAEVALVPAPGERTPCAREGTTFRCPGLDDDQTVRLRSRRVDRRTSECVEVRLPPVGQQLELTLRGDALALVSGARLGLADAEKKGSEGDVSFEVVVDDQPGQKSRATSRSKLKWLQLKTPEERLRVTVSRSSDEGPKAACLIFSDFAWRSVKRPSALTGTSLDRRH